MYFLQSFFLQIILLIAAIRQNYSQYENQYNLHLLEKYPQAKCLDGSPAAYYFYKSSTNSDKLIIYFEGTGWCAHEEPDKTIMEGCVSKTQGSRGSSRYLDKVMYYDNYGFLSSKEDLNPYLFNWNKLFVKGCDGFGFNGNSSEPFLVKNQLIWVRGKVNVLSILDDAQNNYQIFGYKDVLISGCSNGGLAALQWTNRIVKMYPQGTNIQALADGSFYIDTKNIYQNQHVFRQYIQKLIYYPSLDIQLTNSECTEDQTTDEQWKCFLLPFILKYIKIPVFLAEMEYDFWQIQYILGEQWQKQFDNLGQCQNVNNKKVPNIENFKELTVNTILNSVLENKNRGLWMGTCITHCSAIDSIVINNPKFAANKQLMADTIMKWMYHKQENCQWIVIDSYPYPINSCYK